jgi:hypothetical protein
MPHGALKLTGGVDFNRTPALNEASISSCNFIRYMYDPAGYILVQKLGGWTQYGSTQNTITRALWAWEDTNAAKYLAIGNQASTANLQAYLGVLSNGTQIQITPITTTDNPSLTATFSTSINSSIVTITDASVPTTSYTAVYISTQISIGGLVLFGFYQVTPTGSTTYTIQAVDILGNPQPATSNSTTALVPSFTTSSGSAIISVTLANHGYTVGATFPVLIATVANGVTLLGNYTVNSVASTSTFGIAASTTANASGSFLLNNNKANFVYYLSNGPGNAAVTYGNGGYGSGGYGGITYNAPANSVPIYTNDWTLDNFGQTLIACPVPALLVSLSTTSASGNGTTATLTFDNSSTVAVGSSITISGAVPTGYNGTYYVTSSASGSLSYANATTGSLTAQGTIVVQDPASGPIFAWDPTSGNQQSTVLAYGPAVNDGIFVAMPQRQIIAWGSTFTGVQDPLLIRWCDVQNYNQWIAQSTNQAGSYRIPKGSRIVGCIQGPQQALVWTDLALWSMQYIGQPYIYSFNEIAVGCGMIGRKAAGTFNGVVYWMGQSQFFSLANGQVTPIPCPIWDIVFQQLDTNNVNKIRIAVNSQFNEIAWYYPTKTSNGEVAAYVKYNAQLNQWDYGVLGRSAWINESVLGPPIGSDPTTLAIYQHETSPDAAGQAINSYFQTGYFALMEADDKIFLDQFWPDAKWGYYNNTQNTTLQITFSATDFAGTAPTVYGPYSVVQSTTFFSPRFRGRLVSVQVGSSDVGSFWRIGQMRYRYQPDGKY